MSTQLCRMLFKLKGVQNQKFLVGGMNKQMYTQSGLFAENQVKVMDHSSKKTVEPTQKRGLDKNNPILVASYAKKVIVGCNCSSEDPTLKWFYLEEGPAQVCDCGVYFKMDKVQEGTDIPEYSHVMQVDESSEAIWRERPGRPFTRSLHSNKKYIHQK